MEQPSWLEGAWQALRTSWRELWVHPLLEERYCPKCGRFTQHHPKHGCIECDWLDSQW